MTPAARGLYSSLRPFPAESAGRAERGPRDGVGIREDSLKTPPGIHRICEKIGAGAPVGRIFRDREDTGEDWDHTSDEENIILTRILPLEGLEAGVNNDNGTGQGTSLNNQASGAVAGNGGLIFNRRSTVSWGAKWGELRLGRDYTPQFWNQTVYDPFGTNGVGTTATQHRGVFGPTNSITTGVRASNSISVLYGSPWIECTQKSRGTGCASRERDRLALYSLEEKNMANQIKVTLLKSYIGTPEKHRLVLRGLGLRHIRQTAVHPDTPQVRGMIHKVGYLLEVGKP